jgi:single-strand DNA-binding protein
MINRVTLVGRVGRDPETRYTSSGQAVANFTVATDESYKKDGEKIQRTEWHRLVAWGKLAEIIQQYLKKGALVYIEGKLQTREWEKDGVKMHTTEIVASTMKMLGGQGTQAQAQAKAAQPAAKAAGAGASRGGYKPAAKPTARPTAQPVEPDQEPEISDEDIPF